MKQMINVTRSFMPPYEEYCAEIKELWDSRYLTNSGIKHAELEERLREYLGAENACLFANGHLALEYALEAMDLPRGGEVITTPFTFASTTHAIVRRGLVPVFCDISEHDYTIDVPKIEALITEKTCALLPVHVYGNICDIEAIDNIAQKYGLKVIYDAAHAFGVKYKGTGIASFGDISMFSFHATKIFHTVEGGALCFRGPKLKKRLRSMRNFGITGFDEYGFVGGNAKMSELHAAMGLCNLRHIDKNISLRKKLVERYRLNLKGLKGIKLMAPQSGVEWNYSYFPVIIDGFGHTRDEVIEKLAEKNIQTRRYFYPLTDNFSCYKGVFPADRTPVARYVSDRVLCLPLYDELAAEDVDRICGALTGMRK